MKRFLLFFSYFLLVYSVYAEVLKGRVVDAETKEPLTGALVNLEDKAPNGNSSYVTLSTDLEGYFRWQTEVGNMITLNIKYFGYHPTTKHIVGLGGNDTIRIDDIQLKVSEELLREVVVDSKAKRFYMKGDTVIFNPEAFDLENGDRLVALVEKLPGVSIKDGQLLWHGEPLKLMMNGNDALNESMMLNLIPVEAVDKVKAYDRASELQERTGVSDGNEEHVLDIKIKPGFMEKFYTQAEAKVYAGKEYGASVDATKLSDKNPFLLFGRVGNEPFMMRNRSYNNWQAGYGKLPVRQQVGALAYRHLWTPDYEVKRDSRWDISVGANHWDETNRQWQKQQNFIPNTTPTLTSSTSYNYSHNLDVPVEFGSYFNLGEKSTLSILANISYVRARNTNSTDQETSETDNEQPVINTSNFTSISRTEGMNMAGNAKFIHYINGGSLAATMQVKYDNIKEEGSSVGNYQYLLLGTSYSDKQRFSTPRHDLTTAFAMDVNKTLNKDVMLHAMWETSYTNQSEDEQRWRNDVTDNANSYRREDNNWQNTITIDANYQKGRFALKPIIKLIHQHEQIKYNRASLDTLALRNLLLTSPALELTYRLQTQMVLKGTLSYSNTAPDILDCIAYTNDTNPLYVIKGNANLKTSGALNAGLLYTAMLTKRNQALSVGINYKKHYNPIETVLHYNSHTGVYTAQKQNMQGGDSWSGRLLYDCELLPRLRFKNSITVGNERRYGIMTIVDDAVGTTFNRQNLTYLKEGLDLIFEHGNWTMMNFHVFTFDHHAYSDVAQLDRNIYQYRTELRLRYKWNKWNFALSPRYILNHGHTSKIMNGSQILLNATIDYNFLKNRAQLILTAKDILGQEKQLSSEITSSAHIESGVETMHQYVNLTFKYKFDPSKKK